MSHEDTFESLLATCQEHFNVVTQEMSTKAMTIDYKGFIFELRLMYLSISEPPLVQIKKNGPEAEQISVPLQQIVNGTRETISAYFETVISGRNTSELLDCKVDSIQNNDSLNPITSISPTFASSEGCVRHSLPGIVPEGNLIGRNHPVFGLTGPFGRSRPPNSHTEHWPPGIHYDPINPLSINGNPDPDHQIPPGHFPQGHFPPGFPKSFF